MTTHAPENEFSFFKERGRYAKKAKEIKKRARDKYLEQVADIQDKMKLVSDDAGSRAKETIDSLGKFVQENPQKAALYSLGIGFGLGLLTGVLIGRK